MLLFLIACAVDSQDTKDYSWWNVRYVSSSTLQHSVYLFKTPLLIFFSSVLCLWPRCSREVWGCPDPFPATNLSTAQHRGVTPVQSVLCCSMPEKARSVPSRWGRATDRPWWQWPVQTAGWEQLLAPMPRVWDRSIFQDTSKTPESRLNCPLKALAV